MPAKPTEIKKLTALLEADYSDVADCAKEIFNAVEDMIREREQYVIVVQHYDEQALNTFVLQAFGPYPTRNRAATEAQKNVFGIGRAYLTQWRVAPLLNKFDV